MRNKPFNNLLNAICFLVAFLLIQLVATVAVGFAWFSAKGIAPAQALQSLTDGTLTTDGLAMTMVSAVSSLLTIVVFAWCRWSPFSGSYLQSRPWGALTWVVLLAFGTVIPSEWLLEQWGVEMSEQTQHMFEQIMKEPWGYVALGILAPVAEEMVFRGAVLRSLLNAFDRRWHWLPIVLSALLFGAVHGNMAQFAHATVLGLLLGWMYYRTDSIVPGIVLHWVNNTVAYVAYNLLPQTAEGNLIDLFGGNQRVVWLALGFSLCILLPSLFQVATRLRKP